MPKFACAWSYSFTEDDRRKFSADNFGTPSIHPNRYEAAIEFLQRLYWQNPTHVRDTMRKTGIWIVVAKFEGDNLWPTGKPRRVHAIHYRWDDEVECDLPEKTLRPTIDGWRSE